jgi:hypothetical protein
MTRTTPIWSNIGQDGSILVNIGISNVGLANISIANIVQTKFSPRENSAQCCQRGRLESKDEFLVVLCIYFGGHFLRYNKK